MKSVVLTFEEQEPQIMAPPPKAHKKVEDDGTPWIELVTGGRFYYNKPQWDIGAIAHSLSLQCRFTGQCRKFYSVAEHSVLVSRIMEDLGLGDPMEGLLHDGVESVLADVARPAKALLKDYKALDKALDASLRKAFVLPDTMTPGCMRADMLALLIEAKAIMPSKGLDYDAPNDVRAQADKLPYLVNCWTSDNSKEKFMQRMSDIRRRTRGLR
jgi:hypothetical protein